MATIRFPEDFSRKVHSVLPGCTQWVLPDENGQVLISVIGGGMEPMGDGVHTFEMYDFREEEPQGYLSKEDINLHLEKNPI